MTAATTEREQIKQKLGIVDEAPRTDKLVELRNRLRSIAPEIRAGKPEALSESEQIEVEINAEERRQQIAELADAEEASRARVTAEREASEQRAAWRDQQAQAEAATDDALREFERLLPKALDAAFAALVANNEATALAGQIAPGGGMTYSRRRLNSSLEDRLLRLTHDRLGEFHVKPGTVFGDTGVNPLATAKPKKKASDQA